MQSFDGKLNTSMLLHKLFDSYDIESYVDNNSEELGLPPFHVIITNICSEMIETHEKIIRRSDIERSYGHQLFSGRRKPSRDKVLQLAFGFGFDVDATQDFLKLAQKSLLYPRIVRDAAIIKCLNEGKNILEAQQILGSLGLTMLGGDKQYG